MGHPGWVMQTKTESYSRVGHPPALLRWTHSLISPAPPVTEVIHQVWSSRGLLDRLQRARRNVGCVTIQDHIDRAVESDHRLISEGIHRFTAAQSGRPL
jgi:hypothetical protein